MIVTSICPVGPCLISSTLHLFVPTIFLSRHCHYTSYFICHIFPHIYAPVLLIFHPLPKKNQAALVTSTLSKRTGRGVGRTRSVPSNILARRRNGTETWRRRSYHCEHIRLNTHKKILLNGDVPRRNGNLTYSVIRPLLAFLISPLSA